MEELSAIQFSYRLQDGDIIVKLGPLEKKVNDIAVPSFFTRTVSLAIGENRTIKISQAKREEIHEAMEALKKESVTPKDPIEEMIQCGIIFKNYKKQVDFDIKKTHLPFLAGATADNFSALFGKYPPKGSDAEILKKEMDERISKKQPLTYEWFVLFHMRLSILATPENKRSG